MLRGFGKRYFTLASVLAHSVAPGLHAVTQQCRRRVRTRTSEHEANETDEISPPLSLIESLTTLLHDAKPCHCNCFFKRKARLILMLNHYIPRCPYYCTYFAFRRTGVHPPLFA